MQPSGLYWKLGLIVAVVAASMWVLYPPGQKLKAAPDLAGGTILTYEVELPPGTPNERAAIDDTIRTLQDRVDPNGVMNLQWVQIGGRRIEIVLPKPSGNVDAKRQAYFGQLRALLARNVSAGKLEATLRLDPAVRQAELRKLIGYVAGADEAQQPPLVRARLPLLATLEKLWDARAAAEGPYLAAQQAARDGREALEDLRNNRTETAPAGRVSEQIQALEERIRQLDRESSERYEAFLAADAPYVAARTQLLATNLSAVELNRVLDLPTTKDKIDPAVTNVRQAAVERLKRQHAALADQVQAVADAYAEFEAVKGEMDDPNDLIRLLQGQGALAFRIAPRVDEAPMPTVAEEYRKQLEKEGPRAGLGKPYRWFPVEDPSKWLDDAFRSQTDPKKRYSAARLRQIREQVQTELEQNTAEFFAKYHRLVGGGYAGQYYLLLSDSPESSMVHEGERGDWNLRGAWPDRDPDSGYQIVRFALDARGGQYMGQLTGNHVNRLMAIVLDDKVISAPNINSRISTGGIITGGHGGFEAKELDYLIRKLKAGSLQAKLSELPISQETVGPQFGADNLRRGLMACFWAVGITVGFMTIYYFFWGGVASFAMAMNILLVLAAMAGLSATFTLPGIAGMVLTIGMAVDANVLIFERIREELERKADLKTAVRLGFEKALSAIIDSNLTTLITCLILGYTATADVRGFAVVLGIGMAANIFTAIFCSRALIDGYLAFRKPQHLSMLALRFPAIRNFLTPNVNWIGLRYYFWVGSAVLFVVGAAALYARGRDFLDIEFRAGTKVAFELARTGQEQRSLTLPEARARLDKAAELVLARARQEVERLGRQLAAAGAEAEKQDLRQRLAKAQETAALAGELRGQRAVVIGVGEPATGKYSAFSVATLVTDSDAVETAIQEAFQDQLEVRRKLSFKGAEHKTRAEGAPVFPLTKTLLGANIGRPEVTRDASDFVPGVAIVLEELSPATTEADIDDRIAKLRVQRGLGSLNVAVVGLEQDREAGLAPDGAARYKTAVVLLKDEGERAGAAAATAFDDPRGPAARSWNLVSQALGRDKGLGSVTNIQPQISGTIRQQAIVAVALSWLGILVYIWIRFGSVRYGMGAIVAIVHDVVISIGITAATFWVADTALGHALMLEDFRVNLAFIAAVLTLIGYSVNDTIVVFDRVRENRGRLAYASEEIINLSMNQTLSRTVLTGGTTLLSLIALYIVGGEGVRGFAFTMFIGIVVGTYSSIAIAAPFLLFGLKPEQRSQQPTTANPTAPVAVAKT